MPTTIRVPAMLGGDEVGSCEVDVGLSADLTVTLNDWRLDQRTATEITARLHTLGIPAGRRIHAAITTDVDVSAATIAGWIAAAIRVAEDEQHEAQCP